VELNFKNSYSPKEQNIAIFCLKQTSKKDGIYFYANDLIEGLSSKNKVTVFAQKIFIDSIESDKNIEKISLPNIQIRVIKWLFYSIYLPFYLRKKGRYDEIIFSTEDLPILNFLLLRPFLFNRTKVKVVVHDLAEYFISRYSASKDLFRRFFVKRYIKYCDEVITVSKKTKSDIVSLNFKKEDFISIFYNQIKLENIISHNRIIKEPYVLYVSGFDFPSKNHIGLVNLYRRFNKEKFPYQLILAGNSDSNSNNFDLIKEKISEFKLENDITVLRNISKEELSSLYEHCEFTVFPSLYEGFGRPIIESIHYGKVVYSTDVGIFREVSEHPLVLPFEDLRNFKK
tara:strand:- start:7085 stop:8110 length:1026 start_codon:yes stop_codon:yes gene_type:complete